MTGVVYLNGAMVDEAEACISVFDWGFSGGDAAYEVIRTYNHVLFRPEDHVERLRRSLRYLRIDCPLSEAELVEAAAATAQKNLQTLTPRDDLLLWQVVSRGDRRHGRSPPPSVVMYCVPIDFARFSRNYIDGAVLVTPTTRRIPRECVDVNMKLTNRANQLTALAQARTYQPNALPLMLDTAGFIAETNAANFFFVTGGRLCTPAARNILCGVTRAVVIQLAQELGIEIAEGDFALDDVAGASEAFLAGTNETIMPVRLLNEVGFVAPVPGPLTLTLIRAWNDMIGCDYVAQAIAHLPEGVREIYRQRWVTCAMGRACEA